MYTKNERERALCEYWYLKGLTEAFERMLLKADLIASVSEYSKSKTIDFNRKDK